MNFIDSHAHLTSAATLPHVEAILQRAKAANISHILNICTDAESLRHGIALAARHSFIKNAGATTPHDVEKEGEETFALFEAAAHNKQLAAIGETGLDYHYEHSPKEIQKRFLERYLRLSMETKLPVIFHCREAFDDLFAITDAIYQGPAILHCFTGTMQEAKEVLHRGWYLSLSGIVTFKKSHELREIAKIIPLSQLLIETDTPYLAPQSRRGQPNEPSFLPEIAQCIAETKGIEVKGLTDAVIVNYNSLFRFP